MLKKRNKSSKTSSDNINRSPNLWRKLFSPIANNPQKDTSRQKITKENISQYRQDILSKGRKLKYPLQYSKRRLITITVGVTLVAIIGFALWLNHALYKKQETRDFYYSVTKILPLDVADIDGVPVRYQDYLRRIRADIHYYLNKEKRSFNSSEGARELNYHKRKDLDAAIRSAYIENLANKNSIKISEDQVNNKIKSMREADGATEETLVNSLKDFYGWTLDDFRCLIREQMLDQKVSFYLDKKAKQKIEDILKKVKSGKDFNELAKKVSDDDATSPRGGRVVSKDRVSDPSGITNTAMELNINQISSIKKTQINGNNYYYIVRLDNKDDSEISYSVILIRLRKVDNDFRNLKKDGKIREFISVPGMSELKQSVTTVK